MSNAIALPGRPRAPGHDETILAAARTAFLRDGYAAVTMDAVARAAGVGKPAIYRRWASKAELAIAVLCAETAEANRVHRTLEPFVLDMAAAFVRVGPLLAAVLAETLRDAEVRASLRAAMIEPRRAGLTALIATRLPQADAAELDARVAMVSGAFWYRLLLGEPIDAAFARALANAAVG